MKVLQVNECTVMKKNYKANHNTITKGITYEGASKWNEQQYDLVYDKGVEKGVAYNKLKRNQSHV
jgi:hypothetical protein